MKHTKHIGVALLATFTLMGTLLGCQGAPSSQGGAQLYDGFGNYKRKITTQSVEAQRWFDQGMQLMYGFNHDEAIRSFHEAAKHDAASPMPWWGIAYANGTNINDPAMNEERSKAAREAADKAIALIGNASPVEAILIRAVDKRYAYPPPADRKPLDKAYAKAMGIAYATFHQDSDVGALYAESLMNLQPWDYWDNAGNAKGNAAEFVRVLERVMKATPNHPGANHFYIHAVEASKDPDRAEAAADRLRNLVPGSGHLVHMPSHIYVRVGRYSDAVAANKKAVAADRTYFAKAPKPRLYTIYYAHNMHFLAFASMMSGQYESALKAARELEREIPEDSLKAFAPVIEGVMPSTLHVMIRFGKWQDILDEPEYPEFRLVSRAIRRYARSIAYSALGKTDNAREEMAAFEKAIAAVPEEWHIFNNPVNKVLPIGRAMIQGELLFREGKHDEAFAILREGAKAEDALIYDEPPAWMLPVRHALGALLMSAGRHAEAEAVYREDLDRNRNNGWGLLGLHQALRAQGKDLEAVLVKTRVDKAFANADVKPTSSCYCEPGKKLSLKAN